ncbi:MAG: tetratricopeptide repeat protein [Deltaproteobacteria bacterium]|nr:tetratricopeptide repeat protein [Deltaproteobacteria bacterium]
MRSGRGNSVRSTPSPSRGRAALLGLLLLLGTPGPARPEALPPASAEGILSFAQALLGRGDTFQAATEFQRFLHHFPEHPSAPAAWRGLGGAYAGAGRWDDAAGAYGRLFEVSPAPESRLLLGAALYRGARYPEAVRELVAPSPEPDRTRAARTTLATLALLRAEAATVPPELRGDLAAEFRQLPRKSPLTAGALSAAVPGAGHLYLGRPRDAALAFLLNGAFLWGTVTAAGRDEWALAGILGFFELGWYGGSVLSAMNGAHQWNRREEQKFFNRWEAVAIPAWSVLAPSRGLGLAVTWGW